MNGRGRNRMGSSGPGLMTFGLVVLGILGWMLYSMGRTASSPAPSQLAGGDRSDAGKPSLVLYCAAGMRVPIERIVADYESEYGVRVSTQFGGSNTLLSQIEVGRTGDLFLAADNSYTESAQHKGLVRETLPIASIRPVVVVPAENPKQISTIDDLLRADVRVAIGNPDQAASGKLVREALISANRWQPLETAITARGVFQPTVSEAANAVKVGAADAGIVWDVTVAADPKFRAVVPPELAKIAGQVAMGVLTTSRHPTEALRFARFVAARDRGLKEFARAGFQVVEGDRWDESPELIFFCGSVNRRAVEPLIAEFEAREGVRVNTVYNGCGILTGQMKVITDWQQGQGFPDTYMACDRYYLEVVKDQFQDDADVSETEVIIAVPKGNPKKIQGLKDLAGRKLRIAAGQPKQCTIGVLTREILKSEGLLDDVMNNVVAETCSSSLLLPMVTTGSVDAAFVYESDVLGVRDQVEAIRIPSPAAKAVQPFSIAKSSQQKWLSRRLFTTLARHQKQFEAAGFRWLLEDPSSDEPTRE